LFPCIMTLFIFLRTVIFHSFFPDPRTIDLEKLGIVRIYCVFLFATIHFPLKKKLFLIN
jgi:hypothetical protein